MRLLLFWECRKGGKRVETVELIQEKTKGTMEIARRAKCPGTKTLHRAFQQQAKILSPQAARGELRRKARFQRSNVVENSVKQD